MALVRTEVVSSFRSSFGGQSYAFDVAIGANGLVSVRNIRSPNGLIQDPMTGLPQAVVQDVQEAVAATRLALAESSVASGTVSFSGQEAQAVTLPEGLLGDDRYRVALDVPDPVVLRVVDQTADGFVIEASAAYGTEQAPRVVGYDVLVATAQASTFSGSVTLSAVDGDTCEVTFAAPLPSAAYRIVLSPVGPFLAWAPTSGRTKRGFTLRIGHRLGQGQTATVGYDLFI